jgi:hypothetical protein
MPVHVGNRDAKEKRGCKKFSLMLLYTVLKNHEKTDFVKPLRGLSHVNFNNVAVFQNESVANFLGTEC